MVEVQLPETTQEFPDASEPYEKRANPKHYLENLEQLENDISDFSMLEKLRFFEEFKEKFPNISSELRRGFRNHQYQCHLAEHKPKLDVYRGPKSNTRSAYLKK